ncbi:MAG: D-alanyl-D-alanine carboxypeptidase family protein [Clostridiales bacterium]|nr:D-alanyl-D-alanine carboxypeptidase family protein [Clostridiales bacterium]
MANKLLPVLVALLILVSGAIPAQAAENSMLPNAQMLVNPANPLPPDFKPEGLTGISGFMRANGDILLRSDAAAALREMLSALKAAGITDIYACSGYRSFTRQKELHTAKVAYYRQQGSSETRARAQAARWVLPPGQSEHQTGLALDFSTSSNGYELSEAFARTAAGRWLKEHCVEYGFIVRYTAEKETFTGVASEPWHLRYVGADHALYMRQNDLCLEEYHALLREKSPLLFKNATGEERAVHYATGDTSANPPGAVLAVSLARYGSKSRIITARPPLTPLFDTAGHWGEPFIRRLHGLGVVGGYMDGSFRPDTGVSRGEFITAFSRLPLPVFTDTPIVLGESPSLPLGPVMLPYKDVYPEDYYYQPLLRCYRASIVQVLDTEALTPHLFEAHRQLLRGEAALLLAQAFNKDTFVSPANFSYSDVPPPAGQLYRSVELLTARGVLSGDKDGLFHPERGISRAEMSAMLCRLLDAAR